MQVIQWYQVSNIKFATQSIQNYINDDDGGEYMHFNEWDRMG